MNLERKRKLSEQLWKLARGFILFGLCFVILYPLLYMISCAFRAKEDMHDPTVMWIPRHITLDILKQTMKAMHFKNTLKNTLLLNIGCSLVQVISCAVTGYGFARFQFKGKKLLFGIVIMMILVPPQILAIPQYMEFRYCFGIEPLMQNLAQHGKISRSLAQEFNLINTPLTMYLPALTGNGIRAGLMIFLFRQFFRGMPKELEDAAYLDGCGAVRTFLQVMLPNAGSVILTVFLFSVVWYWNDYYVSSTFFTNNQTIALMLKNLDTQLAREIFHSENADISIREKIIWLESGCLISVMPLLILYVCMQKYFIEGIERSGITG